MISPTRFLSWTFRSTLALAFLLLMSVSASQAEESKSREPHIADSDPKSAASIPSQWAKTLSWRSIGPATMGGRIVAFSVYEADPNTYWVATASGGLLKTSNNGITFEHQFDHEATVSLGDVCVAPSNKDIVWVGTGEHNPRNSVSYGDGVYKSTDGGKSWKNMGLKQSFQIGRVVVHPTNPDIVYVGALGRLYGPNEERCLFKTTDGGKTWQKILYVDDQTGVIEVKMHPADPETLLVATWERQRDGFDSHCPLPPPDDGYDPYDLITKWGPDGAIYKTTDGGKSFHKLTKGLPTCRLGRIGLDYSRKNPSVVYAIVDCEKIGMGTPPIQLNLGVVGENTAEGVKLTQIAPDGAVAKAELKVGDIIKAVENKPVGKYEELIEQIRAHKVGDKLTLKIQRGKESKELSLIVEERRRGPGQAIPKRPYGGYGQQRENVQDQQGPNSFEYGGLYKSTDGGESWTRVNSVNPRPWYFSQVRVDPTDDKYVYVLGVALYRSEDGGKSFKPDGSRGVHGDHHALWIDPRDSRHMLLGTDGGSYVTYDRTAHWQYLNNMAIGQFYHVALDSRRPYRVYGGLQDNGNWGGPSHTLDGKGPINEDWISVRGGDGFVCRIDPQDPNLVYCEAQNGLMARHNIRTGESTSIRPREPKGQPPYRFNWNTPFILSSHNSRIFYCGGNYIFRSVKKGDDLQVISREISRTKRGTASALAESPRNPNVLYAGTDDGFLWVTRDGGAKWTNVADKVGLPGPRWVASIEPSRAVEGRAYVVFDAHRSDDDAPYVYVTEDFGQTWKSLRGNLPMGSTRVLREDLDNPDVLYLGTEFGVWASIDRGGVWTRINNNLPTVAVHELAQHPESGEIVAATHGRSLWVLDATPLRQTKPETLKAAATLYRPTTATRWHREPIHGAFYGGGHHRFIGENPPAGAQIYYALAKNAEKVQLKIVDYTDQTVLELPMKQEQMAAGLHRVTWDLICSTNVSVRSTA